MAYLRERKALKKARNIHTHDHTYTNKLMLTTTLHLETNKK